MSKSVGRSGEGVCDKASPSPPALAPYFSSHSVAVSFPSRAFSKRLMSAKPTTYTTKMSPNHRHFFSKFNQHVHSIYTPDRNQYLFSGNLKVNAFSRHPPIRKKRKHQERGKWEGECKPDCRLQTHLGLNSAPVCLNLTQVILNIDQVSVLTVSC